MRAVSIPKVRHELFVTKSPHSLRFCTAAPRTVSASIASTTNPWESADAFVAEYDWAGIKLDPLARRQLRDWYAAELQRASPGAAAAGAFGDAGAPAADAYASKELPSLMGRGSGTPQLTVLWDVESLKPFTQQHVSSSHVEPADEPVEQQHRARAAAPSGGRASRLAAAGLLGGAASPDLVRALDQLCRTLQQYGTIHAVHLFLRESTLGKAPVLRRQVEQLRTWAGLWEGKEEEMIQQGQEAEQLLGTGPQGAYQTRAAANKSGEQQLSSGPSGSGAGSGARLRVSARLPQGSNVHDCPMCRSAHPSRLELLRHFAAAHQAPLMAATAADVRTHIMWTRGRAVGLPILTPGDPRVGADAAAGDTPTGESAMEVVIVSPEDFVYSRELLMRGRHLDGLLAAAPVAVHTGVPRTAAAADASATGSAGPDRLVSQQHDRAGRAGSMGGVGASGAGASGGTLSRRGLHLHMVPAGQPAEEAAEALRQVAEALALEQALPSSPLLGRGGDRSSRQTSAGRAAQQGRGRKGGRNEIAEEAPAATTTCVCLVSDAEGLDQTLAELREHNLLTMAVTRVTRVPSADVSLRWWAVHGGEYRLAAGKQR